MSDYLDANCVITALFENDILAKKEWQIPKAIKEYYVSFELKASARRMAFIIYVIDSHHYIGCTAIKNQSRRFTISIDDIINNCLVT